VPLFAAFYVVYNCTVYIHSDMPRGTARDVCAWLVIGVLHRISGREVYMAEVCPQNSLCLRLSTTTNSTLPTSASGNQGTCTIQLYCCAVLSSRKVLVLEDQFTSPCPWTAESSKIFKDFTFCKYSVTYNHVKSMNSVTTTVHEDTVKNVLLTELMSDITYTSASKPFITVT